MTASSKSVYRAQSYPVFLCGWSHANEECAASCDGGTAMEASSRGGKVLLLHLEAASVLESCIELAHKLWARSGLVGKQRVGFSHTPFSTRFLTVQLMGRQPVCIQSCWTGAHMCNSYLLTQFPFHLLWGWYQGIKSFLFTTDSPQTLRSQSYPISQSGCNHNADLRKEKKHSPTQRRPP